MRAKALGADCSVAVISLVVNPIETGTVSQAAQAAVAVWLDGPGRQINRPAFKMERTLAVLIWLAEIVLQQRVVGVRHPQANVPFPFGQHQFIEVIQGQKHGRVHQNVFPIERRLLFALKNNLRVQVADQVVIATGTGFNATEHWAGSGGLGLGVAATG